MAGKRYCVRHDDPRLFLNGAYIADPDAEVRKFIDYIRTLDGRRLIRTLLICNSRGSRTLTL